MKTLRLVLTPRHRKAMNAGRGQIFVLSAVVLLAGLAALWLTDFEQPSSARMAHGDAFLAQPQQALRTAETTAEPAEPTSQGHLSIESPPEGSNASSAQPDPVGHVVWGYVLDEGGRPLTAASWAWVRFADDLGVTQLASLDKEGAYSTSGIATGRWYLRAGASAHLAQEAVLDLTEDLVTVRQDFQLAPRPFVKIKLVGPGGQPVWEEPFWKDAKARELPLLLALQLLAVATSEPPGERFDGVVGSPNNRFGVGQLWLNGQSDVRLGAEYLGRIDLEVDPPVYVSLVLYHDVIETQRVVPGQDEVTFTLDPTTIPARLGSVEFTVVDGATGDPVEGAQAMLNSKGQAGPGRAADPDGRVRFDANLPGLYDLRISAEGKATVRREVDVPRGRRVDLGSIALDSAVPIRGQAVDPYGNGLVAEIRVEPLPKPGAPLGLDPFRTVSQADGSFEIKSLPAGVWLLQAKDRQDGRLSGNAAELMAPNLVVDTRATPLDALRVQLVRVSAVAARWTGGSPDGLRLRFFDEQGYWRQSASFSGGAPVRVDLLPGCWRLVVSDALGAELAERSFTLGTDPIALELGPDR